MALINSLDDDDDLEIVKGAAVVVKPSATRAELRNQLGRVVAPRNRMALVKVRGEVYSIHHKNLKVVDEEEYKRWAAKHRDIEEQIEFVADSIISLLVDEPMCRELFPTNSWSKMLNSKLDQRILDIKEKRRKERRKKHS